MAEYILPGHIAVFGTSCRLAKTGPRTPTQDFCLLHNLEKDEARDIFIGKHSFDRRRFRADTLVLNAKRNIISQINATMSLTLALLIFQHAFCRFLTSLITRFELAKARKLIALQGAISVIKLVTNRHGVRS